MTAASRLVAVGTVLYAPSAFADMGPLIVVPIAGILLLQIVLVLVLVLPKRMSGRRRSAVGVFSGILLVPWLVNLGKTIDSFSDFYVLLAISVATFLGLFFVYRR